jgi:hypothetical protein
MRKFVVFALLFLGIFGELFAGEIKFADKFRFDGSTFYKKHTSDNESLYFLKNENLDYHFVTFELKFIENVKNESELDGFKKSLSEAKGVLFSENVDKNLALVCDEGKFKSIKIVNFRLENGLITTTYKRLYDPKTSVQSLKMVLLTEARNFAVQTPKVGVTGE